MNNSKNYKKPELLSPAGNPEKLRAAVMYGADAVYLAGDNFGMRAASGNFNNEELAEAVKFCRERGVKIYVTVNVTPRTSEYPSLEEYIRYLDKIKVDAVIVSDIGVFFTVKKIAPSMEIHISTQASSVSAASCSAWYSMGAKRVVLARELSFEEIREIRRNIPDELELEAFVHGAMCIGYSGRCLLSNYFTGRDANHGACVQSCRWNYSPSSYSIDLKEANRPDVPVALSVEEEKGETFFMSSRDTSMIEHIPELEESGISSYKIEGRVKSAYYTAVVTNAYRMAIDSYRENLDGYSLDPALLRELDSVSHREYGTGFFYGSPSKDANTVTMHGYIREKAYLATAAETSAEPDSDGLYEALFIQRNKLVRGDKVEIISPGKTGRSFLAEYLTDEAGRPIESAPHPSMKFKLKVPFAVMEGDVLRSGE